MSNQISEEEWIPVNQPPKEEGYKIISAPGSVGVWVAYWDSEDWIHPERDFDGKRKKITEFVTHWRYLPQPPNNYSFKGTNKLGETPEDILDQYDALSEYPSYYHESNCISAMLFYADQEKRKEAIAFAEWGMTYDIVEGSTPEQIYDAYLSQQQSLKP